VFFFFAEGIEKNGSWEAFHPILLPAINRSDTRLSGVAVIDLVFSPFFNIFHHFSPSLAIMNIMNHEKAISQLMMMHFVMLKKTYRLYIYNPEVDRICKFQTTSLKWKMFEYPHILSTPG